MVQLPDPRIDCDDSTRQCICMTRETKESGLRLIINPISKRHIAYCAAQFSLCSIAWASVAFGKANPTLDRWKGPIVAGCYTGHQALKQYEQNNS